VISEDVGKHAPYAPCEETLALVKAACLARDEAAAAIVNASMGSNVSRHTRKVLDGRRTRSTDNLCHGAKLLAPTMGKLFSPCGGGARGVDSHDRYQLGRSLPTHLNEKEPPAGAYVDSTPGSEYGAVYGVDLTLSKLASDATVGDQGYSSEKSSLRTPDAPSTPLPFNTGAYVKTSHILIVWLL